MATTNKAACCDPDKATHSVRICRIHDTSRREQVADRVVVEEPITIMVQKVGSFTVMGTPSDIEALAVGFVFSEGMIRDAREVVAIETKKELPNVVGLELQCPSQSGIARNMVVASSCGMCGVRNIRKMLEDIPPCSHSLEVPETLPSEITGKLRAMQQTFSLTGSSHAAALFDHTGAIIAFAEDVGRHNAMDKAVGKCLLAGDKPQGCGAVLSGRVSLDIVTKAARAGIELIVAVSGVSSSAVAAAQRWNITLCGFVRQGKMNVYTEPARILVGNHGRCANAG